MKLWALLPLLLGAGAIGFHPRTRSVRTLLLTGDSRGSLSPCGCTKPMTGGVKRLATAIGTYASPEGSATLVNGALTGGAGRQEELKAQALGEILSHLDVSAVRFGREDRDSIAAVAAIRSFLGDRVLEASPIGVGAFQVGRESDARTDIVMIDGGLAEAKALAQQRPELALIQYRVDGRAEWSRQGETLLASPGSKLRDLLVISVNGDRLGDPRIVPLDERVADDAETKGIYTAYLSRVASENLLGSVVRRGQERYIGSKACVSCHTNASKIWAHSNHARALASLESQGHGKDPECVPCHVVALDRTNGFRDRKTTPKLANVGCESCHGSASEHARSPIRFKLARVEPKKCGSCHTSDQSPGFDFPSYWKQIQH